MPTGLDEYGREPVDFDRVDELPEHRYQIQTLTVTAAEDIPGEYPQFGRFMSVIRLSSDSECWIETPRALAREIGDAGLGGGDVLDVEDVEKGPDGRWVFELDV